MPDMLRIASLLCVVLLSASASVALAQAPSPPPIWPPQFLARFGLSDSLIVGGAINNETSFFSYNIDVPAQLINYPDRCSVSPNILSGSKSGCSVLFLGEDNGQGVGAGIYVTQPAENIQCCQLFAGVGPIPRNFTNGFTWKDVESANDYYGFAHQCDRYESGFPGLFKYWTERGTHHDIYFHDGAGANWAWDHLRVGPVDPSVFTLFSDAATCNKSCGLSDEHQREIQGRAAQHGLIQMALHHHQLKLTQAGEEEDVDEPEATWNMDEPMLQENETVDVAVETVKTENSKPTSEDASSESRAHAERIILTEV